MIKKFYLAIALMTLCLFASPLTASAYDVFGGADCSGKAAKSAVCSSKTTEDPISGPNGVLINVAHIIAFIAGAAAIIVIIVSGIRFITSSGDAAKVTQARKTLTGAVIGLVVIILAHTLIVFILKQI